MPRDNWTRDQTIVTLRTYFSVPFNKANNSNEEIIRVAKIIGRGINSVKMKIGNFGSLDPELARRGIVGLSGASNLDREIWNEFSNDREKLAFESTVIVAKLSNKEIEEIIELKTEEIPEGKEKIRLIKTRVNQSFFRDSILGIYNGKCCITGLGISKLLIASHIVPWADDSKNRLNPENGLCLNSIHDKAFDEGLITVTTDYKVKLSKAILDFQKEEIIKKFFKEFEGLKITMPERYFPNKEFLEYHNSKIFIK
ncbi:MAG: HNH endonuclease [Bacteroidetes bacterium]|nr:HNH endonuclease [Bacteroidota bacterium]